MQFLFGFVAEEDYRLVGRRYAQLLDRYRTEGPLWERELMMIGRFRIQTRR